MADPLAQVAEVLEKHRPRPPESLGLWVRGATPWRAADEGGE